MQIGASSLKDTTQEALVKDRADNSLIIFPDGTHDFDLNVGSTWTQPRAAVGYVLMGAATQARWIARPTSARMIQIHLSDAFLEETAEPQTRLSFDGNYRNASANLKPLLTAFASDCDNADTPVLLLETYVSLLLQKLALEKPGLGRHGLASSQIKKVVEHMETMPESKLTLTSLAALIGLSPFHFARAFKASTGMPPHRFQIELRIERAKKMLESTDISIADVSAALGYDDPGYFARLFYKEVGFTPTQYRRHRQT